MTPGWVRAPSLLMALLFRPTRWHAAFRAIDPSLPDVWCLLELTPAQRRNPALVRLIRQVQLARLILAIVGAAGVLALLRASTDDLAFGVAIGALVCLAGGLVGDLVVGLGPSSIGGLFGGFLGGIAFGLAGPESLSGVFAVGPGGIVALGASIFSLGIAGRTAMALLPPLTSVRAGQLAGIVVIGAVAVTVVYGVAFGGAFLVAEGKVGSLSFGLALQSSVSVLFGVLCGSRAKRWRVGVLWGLAFLAVNAAAVLVEPELVRAFEPGVWRALARGMAAGVADGTLICAVFSMPYVVASAVGGPRAGAVAGVMGSGVAYLVYVYFSAPAQLAVSAAVVSASGIAGLTAGIWRPLLFYPFSAAFNLAVFQADSRGWFGARHALALNAAFWDELQFLPQPRLDEHLLLVLERSPGEGARAVERLSQSRQRWAVPRALQELDARMLERAKDVAALAALGREQSEAQQASSAAPVRDFLSVSADLDKALAVTNVHRRRNALSQVRRELESLTHSLARRNDDAGKRFSTIAERWHGIVDTEAERVTREADGSTAIDNPYIVAVPLSAEENLFVGRTDVSAEIERLLSNRHVSPLLLYGQRRMGKTSLLYNLGRLLPRTFVPLFVSSQGPLGSAESFPSFLSTLVRRMRSDAQQLRGIALPELPYEALASNPAEQFDAWLDAVERALGDRRALLCIDELEALTGAFARGRLAAEDVLGLLRHIMQHRRRFGVLLAASQSLEELREWASYLVNMRVLHLSYLTPGEASQLIERPVEGFPLRYEAPALDRIHGLSRGHPWLVQALCHELVTLKNEQPVGARFLCTPDDVAAAAAAVFERSSMLFSDIEDHQITPAGRRVLRALAGRGPGAVADRAWIQDALGSAEEAEAAVALLLRRELLEPAEHGYRFQVELIRQWFARPSMR